MARMTQLEYEAYVARCGRTNDLVKSKVVTKESELHNQILTECSRRQWIVFHGSMAHATFRTPGEPDFVILADGGRVFLIEAKSANGKLSPEQAAINAWASKLGHRVVVVRSLGEFLEVV